MSSTSLPEIHELQARRKTAIEEQFDRAGTFELTSVEQETYERYFYGTEHWNYFSNDEDLGPVVLSLKQEIINGRDQFRSVLWTRQEPPPSQRFFCFICFSYLLLPLLADGGARMRAAFEGSLIA